MAREKQVQALSKEMEESETSDPDIIISEKQLEEVKDWKTGNDYVVKLEITQTDKMEEDGETKAKFDISDVSSVDESINPDDKEGSEEKDIPTPETV